MRRLFYSKKFRNDVREYIEYCKENDQSFEKALSDTIMVFGVPNKLLIERIAREAYDIEPLGKNFMGKIKNEILERTDYSSDIPSFIGKCKEEGLSYSETIEKAQNYFGLSALYLIEMLTEIAYSRSKEIDAEFKDSIITRATSRKVEEKDIFEYIKYHKESGTTRDKTQEDALNYFGTSEETKIEEIIKKVFV